MFEPQSIPAWLLRPRTEPAGKAHRSPTELELCVIGLCVLFLIYTTAFEVGYVVGRQGAKANGQSPATFIGLEVKGSYAE